MASLFSISHKNGAIVMRLPTLSWRHKLITTSLLCLVLPSIITLALTGFHTKNEFQKKAVIQAEQSLEVADLYISNIVNDMISMSNSIQYDSGMITELRTAWSNYRSDKTGKVDFFSFKNITEKLDNFTFIRDLTYVTILLPDGLYFTNYSTYKVDLSFMYEEPWLKQMRSDPINTTRWLGTEPNYVTSDSKKYPHVITIARSFQLYANRPNAYIIISKPEEQFHQIFSKYAPEQIMLLQDTEGTILSQTNRALIGQTIPPSIISGNDSLVRWDGTDYLSVSHALPFAGWSMQSLIASKEVTGNIGSFINYLFILQIVFFIVFSAIMIYLLRQLTNPITQLARSASKVKAGNLDVRSNIQGQDEIGQLGLSFDRMLERIKEMVEQIEWEQTRKRIAELELLQAQINPHFLFNILNSIRLQVMMKGEEEIAHIIGSLSTLLRMTINRNNEFLPLHEEVVTVEHYMKLMNFRHSEGVKLTTNLASDTLLVTIPRFTLQPLIENAYIHGLRQKQGEISISSRKQDSSLYITVQDNGKGMTAEELRNVSQVSGIGLRNVNERLQIIYGPAYTMDLESSPGNGVKITLKLPLSENKEESERV